MTRARILVDTLPRLSTEALTSGLRVVERAEAHAGRHMLAAETHAQACRWLREWARLGGARDDLVRELARRDAGVAGV